MQRYLEGCPTTFVVGIFFCPFTPHFSTSCDYLAVLHGSCDHLLLKCIWTLLFGLHNVCMQISADPSRRDMEISYAGSKRCRTIQKFGFWSLDFGFGVAGLGPEAMAM